MNWIVLAIIMGLAALTVKSNNTVALESLCVLDAYNTCWIDKEAGKRREPQPGDYILSPGDLNRLLEKLKSVQ